MENIETKFVRCKVLERRPNEKPGCKDTVVLRSVVMLPAEFNSNDFECEVPDFDKCKKIDKNVEVLTEISSNPKIISNEKQTPDYKKVNKTTEYVRCKVVKLMNADVVSLQTKIPSRGCPNSYECKIPHRARDRNKIVEGDDVLVKIGPHIYYVLDKDPASDYIYNNINEWQDYTNLKTYAVDDKKANIYEDCFSYEDCKEGHGGNCKIIGVHVIDVASFHPDTFENNSEIKESVKDQTVYATAGSRGYERAKKGIVCPSLSVFFHTSQPLNLEQNITPVATVLLKNKSLHFEQIENYEPNFMSLLDFLVKFALQHQPFPASILHEPTIWQHTDGVDGHLLVKYLMEVYNSLLARFLFTNGCKGPLKYLKPVRFGEDSAKLKAFSFTLKQMYNKTRNEEDAEEPINQEDLSVCLFKAVWKTIKSAAEKKNVILCAILLATGPIHPFLARACRDCRLKKMYFDDNASKEVVFIWATKPLCRKNDILMQKLVHHFMQNGRQLEVEEIIDERFEKERLAIVGSDGRPECVFPDSFSRNLQDDSLMYVDADDWKNIQDELEKLTIDNDSVFKLMRRQPDNIDNFIDSITTAREVDGQPLTLQRGKFG